MGINHNKTGTYHSFTVLLKYFKPTTYIQQKKAPGVVTNIYQALIQINLQVNRASFDKIKHISMFQAISNELFIFLKNLNTPDHICGVPKIPRWV